MTALFLFQTLSMCGYAALVFVLALCPFKGKEFRTYHKVRYLLMAAMGAMMVQFITQMIFKFRAQDPLLGTACNMFFVMITYQMCTMALFHMLRHEDSCRNEWIQSTVVTIINSVVIVAGVMMYDGIYLKETMYFIYFFFAVVNIYFVVVLLRIYHQVRNSLQQYYSVPVETHIRWAKVYVFCRLGVCVCLPIMLLDNSSAIILSVASYFCFIYFTAKLMYYGYYVNTVEVLESLATNVATSDSGDSAEEIDYSAIESKLEEWLIREKYVAQTLSIDTVAYDTKISRRSLSRYFNNSLHMTFREWLNGYRVEYSKKIMASDTSLSIEQVAEMSGFNSRSYFDVVFKEKTGITPSAYHKTLRH